MIIKDSFMFYKMAQNILYLLFSIKIMTTQTKKRSKFNQHSRFKTDFGEEKINNYKFEQSINEYRKSLMKQNKMPVDYIGFTLPSLFTDQLNTCKEGERKNILKNIDNPKKLSTQRADQNPTLKQKMVTIESRQSKLDLKHTNFFRNRSHRQTTINFPHDHCYRRSIFGEQNFLASITSNRHTYARDYSLIRSPCKYLKGKFLIDCSPFLFDLISEQVLKNLKQDIGLIKKVFLSNCIYDSQFCIERNYYSQIRSQIGKLLLFLGIQLAYCLQKEMIGEKWLEKMTKCLHYQIYYSIQMKAYSVALQSLVECSRLYISEKQYEKSEFFCEYALKISVRQSNQYYEQTSLEQISFCQYKLGNIEQAKNLHDNVSKLSLQSRARIVKSYNQPKYLAALRQYLFNGQQLNTKRNVRLVETIGFHKNQVSKNVDSSLAPVLDRMVISKTNRSIHEFRKSQEKVNDLSQKSNQKAIKSIRLKHLHRSKEEDIEGLVIESPKKSECRKFGVQINNMYSLKQYQTLNRSRIQKESICWESNEKNVRLYRSFLQFVDKMVQNQLSYFSGNHC